MNSAFKRNGELLRLTDLHSFYGESHILHGIDLTINHGELVTLLGRNGSGRSTTLRSCSTVKTSKACRHTALPAWAWASALKSAAFFPDSPPKKT